jgi:hypothetical protein
MPFGQTITVGKFEQKHFYYIISFILVVGIISYTIYSLKHLSVSNKADKIVKDFTVQNINKIETYDRDECLLKYKNNYLCDFYIASSAKSFLVGNQRYDSTSLEMIKNCIIMGARYIELEVICNSLDINAKPIVTTGVEIGQWQTSLNSLNFDEVCQTIATYAFSSEINTHQLPFFIYIRLKINNNPNVLSKMGKILNQYFPSKKEKELDRGNRIVSEINPAQTTICSLFNQVVIWSDTVIVKDFDKFQLRLANQYIETINKFPPNRLYYSNVLDEGNDILNEARTPEQKRKKLDNLSERNKESLTIVFPNKDDESVSTSYDPAEAWSYGCQFVAINYQLNDENRISYFNKFMKDSIILKPEPLRKSTKVSEAINIDNLIKDEKSGDDIIRKQLSFFYKDTPVYFRPFNDTSKVLSIENNQLIAKTKEDSELDTQDGFLIKPYLSNSENSTKISLESAKYPNYYLAFTNDGFDINDWRTRKFDEDVNDFIVDATFIFKQALISTRSQIGLEDINNIISPCIQGDVKKIMVYQPISQKVIAVDDDVQNYDYATQSSFYMYKLPVKTMYTIRQSDNKFVQSENSMLTKKTTNVGKNSLFEFVSEFDVKDNPENGQIDLQSDSSFIHIKDNKNNFVTVSDKSLLRVNETVKGDNTRFYLKPVGKFMQIYFKNPSYSSMDLPIFVQSDGVLRLAYPNEISNKETNFIIGTSFSKK